MKPTPMHPPPPETLAPLLVFGAHPDDIEFGAGGIVARETALGRPVHFAVCSRGEAATHGTPAERVAEAGRAAEILGATLEFVELDGDGQLEIRAAHALTLTGIIRRCRPGIVLAPTLVARQHPDHPKLGQLVGDAARLARYGGVGALRDQAAHAIGALWLYAITPEAEPPGVLPVLLDVSEPEIVRTWTAAMAAHGSQAATRPYVELQLARARVFGLQAGVEYAQALFPLDPPVHDSLAALGRGARRF